MNQAHQWFAALLPAEQASYDRYLNLGLETEQHLAEHSSRLLFMRPGACHIVVPSLERGIDGPRPRPPRPDLAARWEAWNEDCKAILRRNPHAGLRELLRDISKNHDATSWPYAYESELLAWAKDGDYGNPPGSSRLNKIVPRPLFNRMTKLRRRAKGWWYWNDEAVAPLWVPDEE